MSFVIKTMSLIVSSLLLVSSTYANSDVMTTAVERYRLANLVCTNTAFKNKYGSMLSTPSNTLFGGRNTENNPRRDNVIKIATKYGMTLDSSTKTFQLCNRVIIETYSLENKSATDEVVSLPLTQNLLSLINTYENN